MMTRTARGSVLAQYAIAVPLLLTWLFVVIQIAMIVVQYYSVMQITRETARWLAVRPDTIDSAILTHAQGLTAALPLVADGGLQSVQATPGCATLTSGRCTARPSGSVVSVQITPNVGRVTFLPSSFGLGQFAIAIPTSLPAYRVSIMVE